MLFQSIGSDRYRHIFEISHAMIKKDFRMVECWYYETSLVPDSIHNSSPLKIFILLWFFLFSSLFIFYLFICLSLFRFNKFLVYVCFFAYFFCFSLWNIHWNPNENYKLNQDIINFTNFLDMSLVNSMVETDIMIVSVSNAIVSVLFYNLVKTDHCYTYVW